MMKAKSEADDASLKRHLEPSAELAAVLAGNLARAKEPALRQRLADAIARLDVPGNYTRAQRRKPPRGDGERKPRRATRRGDPHYLAAL
jgi:hypothetical protein